MLELRRSLPTQGLRSQRTLASHFMPQRIDLLTPLMLSFCLAPTNPSNPLPLCFAALRGRVQSTILGVDINVNRYVITYDLSNERNYDDLHQLIKEYPDWEYITESTWIIKTYWSAARVLEDLEQALDSDDKLLVIVTGTDWASWNLPEAVAEWLNS